MTEQFTVHREPAGPTGSSPEGVCAPDYQFGRVLSPVGTYDGDVVPDSICAMLVVEGSGVVHQATSPPASQPDAFSCWTARCR
ncbi:hypothetical protein [Rathayibacter tanaceti]|uniref:Uncharacterized protein n=1 Tax=Rathayibacter tanaceti TaxID=1671680 RepID=A0A162FZS2_9MICO|nr:hypothetical protein [Rathayibacter tanaceti]KZX21980.1 hypothetical protein ACH61_00899 [Rathayibacter tanaceti]